MSAAPEGIGEREAVTAVQEPQKQAQRSRISAEARSSLMKAFDDANIGQNQKLQSIINDGINQIIREHGLSLEQVKRQFKNWRNTKFFHGGVVCVMTTEEIKTVVESHLSLQDIKPFVRRVLLGMIPGTKENSEHSSSRKGYFDDFVKCCDDGLEILEAILSKEILVSFFVKMVKNYVSIAAEAFPKTAASLPQSEFAFFGSRIEAITKTFAPELMGLAKQHLPSIKCCWRSVAVTIKDALFRSWCDLQYQKERLPITISNEADAATQYSRPVVYYVAGWIISDMKKGGGLRKSVKEDFEDFAQNDIVSKDEATSLALPTDIVERRDHHGRLQRSSKDFFHFVLRIETIYIQNLTIEMMLSYYEGDLLTEIAQAIRTDTSIQKEFEGLTLGLELTESVINEMLAYVLQKFARMRGNWFMKALKGQASSSHKAVAQMATRKNVAAVSAAASAASAAWRKAKQSKQVEDNTDGDTNTSVAQNRNEMYKTLFDTALNGEDLLGGLEEIN